MHEQTTQLLTVLVDVAHGDEVNYFFTRNCPYCPYRHQHGAGRPGEDPRRYEHGRMSHCSHLNSALGNFEYDLVWTGEVIPVVEIARVQADQRERAERERKARCVCRARHRRRAPENPLSTSPHGTPLKCY